MNAWADPATDAVTLAAALRRAGLRIGTDQVVTYRRALAAVDGRNPEDRYWAARLTFVGDVRDLGVFERVHAAFEAGSVTPDVDDGRGTRAAPALPGAVRDATTDRPVGSNHRIRPRPTGAVATDREELRHRRFDRATEEELAEISAALARIEVAVPRRRTRRRRPGPVRDELDLPRTLERVLGTGGEVVDLVGSERRTEARRLVVLLDVSGSMASYARVLLRFALAVRRTSMRTPDRRVEVFAFGTRLTRLTDVLDGRDPDRALQAAADRVTDWDGGTRIADSIRRLTRVWGPRGLLRGAIVVICSDGLERGDPAGLGDAVARLRRHAHRIVWVNPLAGDPRFTPTQRGMAAALPHVDVFSPGHDLASLESLADVLTGLR